MLNAIVIVYRVMLTACVYKTQRSIVDAVSLYDDLCALFYTFAEVAVPQVVRHLVLTPARPIIANTAKPAKIIKPV
jgi:hypothetical protein